MFRRREPLGDPGDVVTLLGAIDVGSVHVGPIIEVVVTSATFGAVPTSLPWQDGDNATITCNGEAFAQLYTEMTDTERSILALEQAAEAHTAKKASTKRDSPWSRS